MTTHSNPQDSAKMNMAIQGHDQFMTTYIDNLYVMYKWAAYFCQEIPIVKKKIINKNTIALQIQ
uniref:Uncharacterized protein n=1 Tax=Anguilla anguilla TaxID=7936 RepID=A0A0E9WGT8_ANGAN